VGNVVQSGAKTNPSPRAAVHRRLEMDFAHTNRVSMMGEPAASLVQIRQPMTVALMDANASCGGSVVTHPR